jgi:hypothetical protein
MDKQTRQEKLREMILNNEKPVVFNASGIINQETFTMGDLEDIGWMTKFYTHDAEGEVDGWTRCYYGPNPILVETLGSEELQELENGDEIG